MATREKTSITVDPELWHKFQVKIAIDQTKSTRAIDEALSAWIDGGVVASASGPHLVEAPDQTGAYPKQHANWHELLEIILDSQTKHAIDAIQRNLEMFAFAVEVAGPKSPDEIRRLLRTVREGRALDKSKNLQKPKKNNSHSA